jgi:hypothetical protein
MPPSPLLAAALAALVALPAAAGAAGPASSPAERPIRLELSAGALRLDYAEYAPDGVFLDGEQGWIPSVAAAFEIRGRRGFFRGAGRLARGRVDYDGHVQSADPAVNGLPARSVSDAQFALVELQAGVNVDPWRRLALLAGLAARRWDREIRSTDVAVPGGGAVRVSGLDEVYTWYELQAGLRLLLVRAGPAELELEGAIVRTAGGTVKVDLGREIVLDVGGRTGFRAGGSLRWAIGQDRALVLGGHWERYEFGQSPVVLVDPGDPTSGVLEPRSETVAIVLEAGLGFRF